MATAAQVTVILAAAVFLAAFYDGGGGNGVWAQPLSSPSPAFAPGPSMMEPADCMTSLLNMSDCLTFVEKGSNLTVPEKPCCGELAGLVDSSPICLCQLLATSDTFGVQIDLNKALKLPSICSVDTPPPSTCSLLGYPIDAPSEAPTPGTAGAPSSGNKDDNGVSSIADSSLAFLVGLAIAFIPSFF